MKNYIIFALLPLFLTNCGSDEAAQQKSSAPNTLQQDMVRLSAVQEQNAGISFTKVTKRAIASMLRVNGAIEVPPQNQVSVCMPMGGYLKNTRLLPGMQIKKGEVIATMTDRQYIQLQQDYLTARSRLRFLELEYQRQKDLNQSKATSDKVFQETEMDYKNQKIALQALGQNLRLLNINPAKLDENNLSSDVSIYAPISGFVSKVNVNIGKYVNPSDVLFELINPDDIHLNLKVYEKDLPFLAVGQLVSAFTNNDPDVRHPCGIILISRNLSADRSAEVHCHFDRYDHSLLPGMYMNAEIKVKSRQLLTVENDAVVSFEGKDYLFVQRAPHLYQLVEIEKGIADDDYVAVALKSGASAQGLKIVRNGAYALLMELKNSAEEE